MLLWWSFRSQSQCRFWLLLAVWSSCSRQDTWGWSSGANTRANRRDVVGSGLHFFSSIAAGVVVACPSTCRADTTPPPQGLVVMGEGQQHTSTITITHPFVYTSDWTGTQLSWQTLDQAASLPNWEMGKWPDPLLRQPAQPVDSRWYGSSTLEKVGDLLRQTAQREGAVGLAAQQCGVNARMVYLERTSVSRNHPGRKDSGIVMVNPRIVARSPEAEMQVWQEECLVLPPTFVATVLRDAWVQIEYYDDTVHGQLQTVTLQGEPARCAQHELDHDRGILVTDHVGLEELVDDAMRTIETPGHSQRMQLAYGRSIETSLLLANVENRKSMQGPVVALR